MLYIYTVTYNRPEFIKYQYLLFKKFLVDDFEYIVFNNTMTDNILNSNNVSNNILLDKICKELNINYVDVDVNLYTNIPNDASKRAGISIDFARNYMFKKYNDVNNIFALIDSDAFLISKLNIKEFMDTCKLSGRYQYRVSINGYKNEYITNQIVIYKPSDLIDNIDYLSFLPGHFNSVNCDCGGAINYLFKNIDNLNFKNWNNLLFSELGNNIQISGGDVSSQQHYNDDYKKYLSNDIINYIEKDTSILNKRFPFCEILVNDNDYSLQLLHLRSGSNWINYDINERLKLLYEILNKLLN